MRLATDPVVLRSSPVTDIIRYALLVNEPKYVESAFVVAGLFM